MRGGGKRPALGAENDADQRWKIYLRTASLVAGSAKLGGCWSKGSSVKTDWKWGWVAIVPGMLIGVFFTDQMGLFSEAAEWRALAAWICLAGLIATAILWIVNQRSVRKLKRAGRPVQLVVRPFQAIMNTPEISLVMFGAFALAKLVFWGEVSNWQVSLIVSCVWGYFMALAKTAYVGPD